MNHPLTDEICDSIAVCYPYNNRIDIEDCGHITDMRRAADWQLEACTEEVQQMLYVLELADVIDETCRLGLLNIFKKAMRPQEES